MDSTLCQWQKQEDQVHQRIPKISYMVMRVLCSIGKLKHFNHLRVLYLAKKLRQQMPPSLVITQQIMLQLELTPFNGKIPNVQAHCQSKLIWAGSMLQIIQNSLPKSLPIMQLISIEKKVLALSYATFKKAMEFKNCLENTSDGQSDNILSLFTQFHIFPLTLILQLCHFYNQLLHIQINKVRNNIHPQSEYQLIPMNDELGKSLQLSVNQKFGIGTYRVLQPIKRGKDGYVYKIQFIKEKRLGALKVLPKSSLNLQIQPDDKQQCIKKYRHEANLERKAQNQIKIHSSIQSGYVVRLQSWYKDDMNFYMVLQYISKGDLGDELNRNKNGLHIERVKKIGLQLAKGIDTIHKKQIVHRDIKPQNILLTEEDEIKICDFSCARELNTKNNELLQGAIGTLQYMAPQILGKYNQSIDVWSFGCVLYIMATGSVPFKLQSYVLNQYIKKINQNTIKQLNQNMLQKLQANIGKIYEKHKNRTNAKPGCQFTGNYPQQLYCKLAHLLKRILVFDPKKRCLMAQIIRHPFFTGQALQISQKQSIQQELKIGQNQIKGQSQFKLKNTEQHNQTKKIRNVAGTIKHSTGQINCSDQKQEQIIGKSRPKTSYSLQSIKKRQDREHINQGKAPNKMSKTTQQILQKHREKHYHNLQSNAYNSNSNQNYLSRLEKMQEISRNSQAHRGNQNQNILNTNQDLKNKNKKQMGNNFNQLIRYKLNDKNVPNLEIGIKKDTKSKYIGDSVPIAYNNSHPYSFNSSSQGSQPQFHSRSQFIEPLNCQGLNKKIQLRQDQQVIINQHGLRGVFIKSNKSMLISPKGKHITLSVAQKSKVYQLQRLPEKYTKLYEDYKHIVNELKLKSNKLAVKAEQRQLRACKTSRDKQQKQSRKNVERNNSIQKNEKKGETNPKNVKFQAHIQSSLNMRINFKIPEQTHGSKTGISQKVKQFIIQFRCLDDKIEICLHSQKNQQTTQKLQITKRQQKFQQVQDTLIQLIIKIQCNTKGYKVEQFKKLFVSLNKSTISKIMYDFERFISWMNKMPKLTLAIEQNHTKDRDEKYQKKQRIYSRQKTLNDEKKERDNEMISQNNNRKVGISHYLIEKERQRHRDMAQNMNMGNANKYYDHRLLLENQARRLR